MTREKSGSIGERRTILDLSWPQLSVNSNIVKTTYIGVSYKLKLPSVDDLVSMIIDEGQGCWLFSVDLARCYRQFRCDPLDYPLLGIYWGSMHWTDVAIPFGIRWGTMVAQRVTDAIRYILEKTDVHILNYIDDMPGAKKHRNDATAAIIELRHLLKDLGIDEADTKASWPSQCMVWLGIEFDTVKMEIRIPNSKIIAATHLLRPWNIKTKTTSLFHIAQCVRPARLFVSCMLDTLRQAPRHGYTTLSAEFHKDVAWFLQFLSCYNGVSIIEAQPIDATVEFDSCLTGCVGISGTTFYSTKLPDFILEQNHIIVHLEALNIVVGSSENGTKTHHECSQSYTFCPTFSSMLGNAHPKQNQISNSEHNLSISKWTNT